MRALITLGLILAGTSYLSSQNSSWYSNNKRVTGNGNVVEKTHAVKDFHSLQIGDAFKVRLIQDDENKVVIITDENLHEHIAVINKNGILSIQVQADFREFNDLTVYITFKELDNINFDGECIVDAENQLKFDELDFSLTGATSTELDIEVNTLNIQVSGASTTTLSGSIQKSNILVNGAGSFNAEKLSIDEVNINVSGGGTAEILVNEILEANVSGGGMLEYSGDPTKVEENISGGGSCNHKK